MSVKENMNKIHSQLIELIASDEDARALLNYFETEYMTYYLVGGAVRDMLNDREPRDYDFMVSNIDENDFEDFLCEQNITYKRNNFNGFKIESKKYEFDVWKMQNQICFKENIYDEGETELKNTTFTNYDSLFVNLKDERILGLYKDYEDHRIIDLVGNDDAINNNPTPYMNIAKIYKTKIEEQCDLSDRVLDYIKEIYESDIRNFGVNLKQEYKRHYKTNMPQSIYKEIIEAVK